MDYYFLDETGISQDIHEVRPFFLPPQKFNNLVLSLLRFTQLPSPITSFDEIKNMIAVHQFYQRKLIRKTYIRE